jgi:hypothetical protein
MDLAWSVLVLALAGMDGWPVNPPPDTVQPASAPVVEIRIDSSGCASPSRAKTSVCIATHQGTEGKTCNAHVSASTTKLAQAVLDQAVPLIASPTLCVSAQARPAVQPADPDTNPPAAPKDTGCNNSQLLISPPLLRMPKVAKNGNPIVQEKWPMTLEQAIRIALDDRWAVRLIGFGPQGLPVGGFEPAAPGGGGGAGARAASAPASAPIAPLDDPLIRIAATNNAFNGAVVVGMPPGEPGAGHLRAEGDGAQSLIARLDLEAEAWRFKAEVMAQVRSVEQQYWSLAQAHVLLSATERAVNLTREILDREKTDLQRATGTGADIAEAEQRLERLNRDLAARTSEVCTIERSLRNLLGLPPSNDRPIIPVTPPAEQFMTFDWDTCVHQMMENQPDIVRQELLTRVAELQLLLARNQLRPVSSVSAPDRLNDLWEQSDSAEWVMCGAGPGALESVAADNEGLSPLDSNPVRSSDTNSPNGQYGFTMPAMGTRSPLANTRQAQYALLRARAYLDQVKHQTTHTLARFFLEVDANHKQYETARRLRNSAAQRLVPHPL